MTKIFNFTGAGKIIFGCGAFDQIVGSVRELKRNKPLIVIDKALASNGFREKIDALFEKNEMNFSVFDEFEPEPNLETVDEGAKVTVREKNDIVIGMGGGSAMDVAKAIAAVAANNGNAEDFLGLNNIPGPGFPKIMIPTTAGTGSEVTFTAVFMRENLKKKEGMNSPYLYPEIALLDPLLTLSVPPLITATTGLDALCHAIESYTSINANQMSSLFSLEAINLISSNIRTCVHDGGNIRAREKMLLGSLYAGLGLANAGVGAVHSLSYPLGGSYGISHGLGNTILLPYVMKFNVLGAIEKFAVIAEIMGKVTDSVPLREAAYLSVEAVEELIEDCDIRTGLAALGVEWEKFEELAKAAMTVRRPLENNPRKLTVADAIEIYSQAF